MAILENPVYAVYWHRFQRQNSRICCFPKLASASLCVPSVKNTATLDFCGFPCKGLQGTWNKSIYYDRMIRQTLQDKVLALHTVLKGTKLSRILRISDEKLMLWCLTKSLLLETPDECHNSYAQSPPRAEGTCQVLCLPTQATENSFSFPGCFCSYSVTVMAISRYDFW